MERQECQSNGWPEQCVTERSRKRLFPVKSTVKKWHRASRWRLCYFRQDRGRHWYPAREVFQASTIVNSDKTLKILSHKNLYRACSVQECHRRKHTTRELPSVFFALNRSTEMRSWLNFRSTPEYSHWDSVRPNQDPRYAPLRTHARCEPRIQINHSLQCL